MAEKKNQSQAEKAVNEARKKTAASTSKSKSTKSTPRAEAKKSARAEKKAKVSTEYDAPIPNSAVIGIVCLALFGAEGFIIPAMGGILLALTLLRPRLEKGGEAA